MKAASSFTFSSYTVDTKRSILTFTYRVEFQNGKVKTYTDRLFLKDIPSEAWGKIPTPVLESTLQALLLMLGINYWSVFRTKNIRIEGFTLTKEQARFWDALYLNGLGEFFYVMQMDFHDLIAFPYDEFATAPMPTPFARPTRALLLNGAGKDSVLSAEILKAASTPFDFFAFAPTPAHQRIGKLVGAKTISVTRRRDSELSMIATWSNISTAYPSVSTFTFIAVLLAELLGYNSIIFSNERSADIGNVTHLGLPVNHQWCKSTEAEKLINDYIQRFITTDISTSSLLREYSELEIVQRFVRYPQYLHYVTSCNCYFGLTRPEQLLSRTPYWCRECPKCVFLFACFSAFLPRKEMISIFGADLYTKKRLVPLFKRILGVEGFKPLDCVGEPEEMILAMHYAQRTKEYEGEPVMRVFEEYFPDSYDFEGISKNVISRPN